MSRSKQSQNGWRRFASFLRGRRTKFLAAAPLGVLLPGILFMASLGPDDAGKNLSKWPAAIGWDSVALWLNRHATGPRIFWALAICVAIYGAVVWGIPAIIERTKKKTAIILAPIATFMIIACVGIGAFIIGRQPTDWALSSSQKDRLTDALRGISEKFPVAIGTVPAAPSDAVGLGYDLMNLINTSPGWRAVMYVGGDAEYHPDYTGLLIAFKAGTDPTKNKKAQLLRALLETTGYRVWYAGHNNFPEGESMLVIGRRP